MGSLGAGAGASQRAVAAPARLRVLEVAVARTPVLWLQLTAADPPQGRSHPALPVRGAAAWHLLQQGCGVFPWKASRS